MSVVLADEEPSGYFGVGTGIMTLVGCPRGVPVFKSNDNVKEFGEAFARKILNDKKDGFVDQAVDFCRKYNPDEHVLKMTSKNYI